MCIRDRAKVFHLGSLLSDDFSPEVVDGVGKIKRGAASHVNRTARGHDFIFCYVPNTCLLYTSDVYKRQGYAKGDSFDMNLAEGKTQSTNQRPVSYTHLCEIPMA